MTTLQRSAVSFRRQGSSGRIWDDRLQIQALNNKAAARSTLHSNKIEEKPLPDIVRNQNQDRNFQERNMIASRPIGSQSHSNVDDDHQKVQRCSLSAMFGRCMGSPTP